MIEIDSEKRLVIKYVALIQLEIVITMFVLAEEW